MLAQPTFGAVAPYPGQIEFDGGERASDIVVNFTRNAGALLLDAGVQMLGQLGQAFFGGRQLLHGAASRAPGFMYFQGALDHMRQAGDLVLSK